MNKHVYCCNIILSVFDFCITSKNIVDVKSFISQLESSAIMDQQAHVMESVVAEPAPAALVEPQADVGSVPVKVRKIQKKRKFVRTASVQLPMRGGGFVEVPRFTTRRDMTEDYKRARVIQGEAILTAAGVKVTNDHLRLLRIAARDVNSFRTKKRKAVETTE